MHHTVEGTAKFALFRGEMTKRDEAIKAFKDIAERPPLQRRWLPTKAWVDAIDHGKRQTFTMKMVSTAINFICQSMGSKFITTKGEFDVFHAAFVVNTGLEDIMKQKVHFYYVQPATWIHKPIVCKDICYWQQQYDKFSNMRKSNRKREAIETVGSTKPPKQPRNVDKPHVDKPLSKDLECNHLQLISKLLSMHQQESLKRSNPGTIPSRRKNSAWPRYS